MIYILRYTLESKCVGISIALKDNQKKKTKQDFLLCHFYPTLCILYSIGNCYQWRTHVNSPSKEREIEINLQKQNKKSLR